MTGSIKVNSNLYQYIAGIYFFFTHKIFYYKKEKQKLLPPPIAFRIFMPKLKNLITIKLSLLDS